MNIFRKIFSFLIIFLMLPSNVFAQMIVGPATYVYEDPSKYLHYDDYQDPKTDIFKDFIELATVVQLEEQDYEPHWLIDLKENSTLAENITGVINPGFGDLLPNFAVKNEVILNDLAPPSSRMNVSTTDRFGSPYHSSCVYQELSPQECQQAYQPQSGNSDNPLFISTPLQRTLPRELWLEEQKKLAASYERGESQDYLLTEDLSSHEVAQDILNIKNVKELQDLSPEERQRVYALEPDKHIVPIVIVVEKVPNPDAENQGFFKRLARSIIDILDNYPKIITTWVPSLKGVKSQSGLLTKTALPQELGKPINNRQTRTVIPGLESMDNPKEAYIKKVEISAKQTTPKDPRLQFSGANINPKSTNVDPTNVNAPVPGDQEEEHSKLSIYKVSLIVPPEIADLYDNGSDLAKSIFPQALGDFPDSFVEIPLNKTQQELSIEGIITTTVTVECPEGFPPDKICTEEVEERKPGLSFSNDALSFSTVKDWITPYQLYGEKQALRSINDPERYNSTCFWNEFNSKNPDAQSMLALPQNYTSILNTSNCPDNISGITARTPSTTGSVCSVASQYNMPCCLVKGVMEVETGQGTGGTETRTTPNGNTFSCCHGDVCGPAQIHYQQYDAFDGGNNLDVCSESGAAELLARAMLLKKCQAEGVCQSYNWSSLGEMVMENYYIDDGEYHPAGYFYGLTNGCTISSCSQYRWGEGKGYCDSVRSYCETGSALSGATDWNFCEGCNEELIRANQSPIVCR